MNQKQKYQQKLEERSMRIRCCEEDKRIINSALKSGNCAKAIETAEQLNYFAKTALHDKIGGRTNFRGYARYSYQILKDRGVAA